MKKILIFSATWCGPCRQLHKVIDEILPEHPEWNIEFKDVDDNEELCEQYHVLSVPTIVFFNEESGEGRNIVGIAPNKTAVEELITSNLEKI